MDQHVKKCAQKRLENYLRAERKEAGMDFTHPGLTLAHTRTWSQDKSWLTHAAEEAILCYAG